MAPFTLRLTGNSGWAVDGNDGLQWAGKGLSGMVRGGVEFQAGPLSVALRPQVAWAENRDFAVYDTTLVGYDRFAYPWKGTPIDWPRRPGAEAVTWVTPGESRIALEGSSLQAALSTEQLRWGPSLAFPLLLGPSAPGFPHLRLGTLQPVALGGLGAVEVQLLWGRLAESEHYDQDPDNDHRLLSGLVFSFHPAVLRGFSVGAASLVHSDWSSAGAGDLLAFLQAPVEGDDGQGNVDGNGLGAIFARWAVPGSGFEAWVEWARDDYSFDVADFLSEPDHTQAYTLGFQHVGRWNDHLVRLSGELTHLTNDEPKSVGGRPRWASFYTHAVVSQGHTHRGQLLGSPTGPGSDAQRLSLDFLRWGHLWGGWVERVRRDEDAYVRYKGEQYLGDGHDVELSLGLRHARPLGALRLEVEAGAHLRRNRLFTELRGGRASHDWERNLRLQATLGWIPPSGR